MARTLTNGFTLAVARQQSRGVLGGSPAWHLCEPNPGTIARFGGEIATVVRNPISPDRQRRKGGISDLDSGVEYEEDLTFSLIHRFAPGFVFAQPTNRRLQAGALFQSLAADNDPPPAGTDSGYTHSATTAALDGQLLYARGFSPTGVNNGLKEVIAGSTTTATLIATALTDETPANTSGATLETAGWRFTDLTWNDTTKTLGSAGTNMTTIGLTPGQELYIGGPTAAERFASGTAFARVISVATNAVVVDKLVNHLGTGFNGGGNQAADAVDLLFGQFLRNVEISHASFLEQYFQFEGQSPDLYETEPPTPVANPDAFEYSLDNLLNTFAISFAGQDKATVTLSFIGTDTEEPVDNASRKANASTPVVVVQDNLFNTTSDFIRLRIEDLDETGLTTDLTEMTVTFDNEVNPEKVLAVLGARYLNYGNFLVDIEATALFTSPEVIDRIRNNTEVSMDWILTNGEGALCFDIPAMTLGNGGRDYPENETVKVNLTGTAHRDELFGTSIGISIIPWIPTS